MKIRVYYEDTDAGGIVYHSRYINFCERARSEAFFELGMLPVGEENSGFVVRHIEADFISMARLGDLLEVSTNLIKEQRTSIFLEQNIYKEDKLIFSMNIHLVYVVKGRPRRIPSKLLEIIQNI